MAAGSPNILREFLVKLGFQTDSPGMARFGRGMQQLTKDALDLTAGITAMAAAIGYAVSRTARHFDELYYASQRTGATAENLMKLRFVAGQIGLSADQLQGQVEGLARTLRDAPNMKGYLDTVTRGMTAGLRDPVDMIQKVTEFYRDMMRRGGYAEMIARMQLQNFGIDPDTIRQMAMNLDVARSSAAQYAHWLQQLHITAQEAAQMGVNVQRGLNSLWGQFSLIWQKTAIELFPVFEVGLENINRYIGEHQEALSTWIEGTLRPWVTWLTDPNTWKRFKADLDEIIAGTDRWATAATNVSTTIRDIVKFVSENTRIFGLLAGAYAGARLGPVGAAAGAAAGYEAAPRSGREEAARQDFEANQWRITKYANPMEIYRALHNWLSEKTHSPNVEIYEAKGMWTRMRDWLYGSTSVVPMVRIQGQEYSDSTTSLRKQLEDFFGGGNLNQQPGGYRPAGRFGGAAPSRVAGAAGAGGPFSEATQQAISRAEGTWQGGGINWNRMSDNRPDIDLSRTSLAQAIAKGGDIGGLQLNAGTIGDAMRSLKLPESTMMTPDTQRQIARWVWGTQGPHAWVGLRNHPEQMRAAIAGMAAGDAASGAAAGANTRGISPQLLAAMRAAAAHLPPGWQMRITSGARTGGLARSLHHGGHAMDIQLYDPRGRAVANRGEDVTGMYGYLARLYYAERQKMGLGGAWGGNFETSPGSRVPDLMHYDEGPDRGRWGSLAEQFKRLGTNPPGGSPATYAAGNTNTISLNPKTDIHVYGAGGGMAQAVVNAQGRVNADTVRILNTALR